MKDFEAFAKMLVVKGIIIGYSKTLKRVYVGDSTKAQFATKALKEGGYGDYEVVVTGFFQP